MGSSSERSFGARLQKGYDLQTFIGSFAGYAAPREQETPASMKTLLDSISTANADVTKAKDAYSMTVSQRQKLFKDSETSMTKSLSQIAGAVKAQYGNNSKEAELISGFIARIRSAKVEKLPTNPDDPDAKELVSRSTRSYGAVTQIFSDIVTTLGEFDAFKPANSALTVVSLTALAKSLLESNLSIAGAFQTRSDIIAKRLALYSELTDRSNRIKNNVKSQYGNNSKEHKLVKGIAI
jgi:hypothetical protein